MDENNSSKRFKNIININFLKEEGEFIKKDELIKLLKDERSDHEKDIILKEIGEELREKLNELPLEDTELLNESLSRTRSMINYTARRIDYAENQRTSARNRIQITLILLFTYITLYLSNIITDVILQNLLLKFLLGFSLLIPISYAIKAIIRFELDTSPEYAYRSTAKSPWYYRYVLDPEVIKKIGKPIVDVEDKQMLHAYYFNDLAKFSKVQFSSNKRQMLLNDLEQLFILHIIVGYKHKFVQEMSDRLLRLNVFVILSILLSIFYAITAVSLGETVDLDNAIIFLPWLIWLILTILAYWIKTLYRWLYRIKQRILFRLRTLLSSNKNGLLFHLFW
ncbi:MAG: hypothetical protein ACFFAU_13875 [Candidatus Hodarchaeota archaeon]